MKRRFCCGSCLLLFSALGLYLAVVIHEGRPIWKVKTLLGQARSEQDHKEYADAEKDYKRALATGVWAEPVHRGLASLYMEQRRYREAVVELSQVLAARPKDVRVMEKLGECCRSLGRTAEADLWLERARKQKAADDAELQRFRQRRPGG